MKSYSFKIGGKAYNVSVNSVEGNIAKVNVNGKDYEVEMENAPAAPVAAPAAPAAPVAAAPAPAAAAAPAGGKDVISPLPGVILSINVTLGQKVKAGDKVAVLEAMKMENDIEAEVSGTVTAILVQKGDSVLEGAPIVKIG